MIQPPVRSILFAPGCRPELFGKAADSGADAIALDLEDSVPTEAKPEARAAVAAWLSTAADRLTLVRINHPARGGLDADLSILAPHANQAVMAPKIERPEDIGELDARLAAFERRAGLEPHAISIAVVIESALGLRNLFATASSTPRVRGAGLATAEEGDLMVDLGGRWTASGEAMAYARGKFVCDARAAGVSWLIDGAFMNLADHGALERECALARTFGFNGKVAVHPRQVAVIQSAFSPTADEVERARALIDAFREAEASGRGAFRFRGMMVDYANLRRAEQVLAISARRHRR
jgi:citrate lyase subunit beta/citryl-CoA lyase